MLLCQQRRSLVIEISTARTVAAGDASPTLAGGAPYSSQTIVATKNEHLGRRGLKPYPMLAYPSRWDQPPEPRSLRGAMSGPSMTRNPPAKTTHLIRNLSGTDALVLPDESSELPLVAFLSRASPHTSPSTPAYLPSRR
jgi:hypothetical protein